MGYHINEIFVNFCLTYFFMQFIQISVFSNQFQNNKNYCYLDFFNSAKLGLKKNIEFDISRLSRRGWFKMPYKKEGTNHTFYFSLCLPDDVEEPPQPCLDRNSLTCVTKQEKEHWVEIIPNAGAHFSRFTFEDNQLQLSLQKSSVKCNDSSSYKTVFKISCSKVEQTPVLNTEDPCTYVVLWNHPVACPIQDSEIQNSCVLHKSGYKFDLRPLRHETFINVQKKFEVNICGYINEGRCKGPNVTVCDVKGNTTVARGDNTRMFYDKSVLILQYLNETDDVQAELHFRCGNSKHTQLKHKGKFVFEMQTSLVCPEGQCSKIINKVNKYSWDILHNEYKNYEVDGYKKGIKYIFNFCGPLLRKIPSELTECKGVICMKDLFTNTTLNIGTRVLPPNEDLFEEADAISYQVVGGDYCPFGGTNQAKFILLCHEKDLSPQFIRLESKCNHLFLWKTPAACPYKYSEGESGYVEDPLYNHQFYLNSVQKTNKDYKVIKRNDIFDMNVCRVMKNPCVANKTTGVCVCWTHKGFDRIAIGYNDTHLEYLNGQILLSMDGHPCQPSGPNKSHVVITFTCQMDSKETHPYLLTMDIQQCFFHFVWPTPHVCISSANEKCIISDSHDYTYNLYPLTRTNKNYIINYNENGDRAVILLNVCRTVISGQDVRFISGVSLYNMNASVKAEKRYINLGNSGHESGEYLNFKNDMLWIHYTSGSLCPYLDTSYGTSIAFICNPDLEESEPQLIEVNQCKFLFIWETKAACPVLGKLKQVGHEYLQNDKRSIECTVQNPVTNFRIDLRPLMDDDYVIKTREGPDFHVAVCRNLMSKNKCLNGCNNVLSEHCDKTGACLNGISRGVANSVLQLRKGAVFLRYENGNPCNQGRNYTTEINFICNANELSVGPLFIHSDNKCTSFIQWETSLVCERKVKCVAASKTNDYSLDLSPLVYNSKNFQIKEGNDIIYISVCRPLRPVNEMKCPAGSSVCRATNRGNSTFFSESLGYLSVPPVVEDDRSVWLRYDQGGSCFANPNENYSTAIQFICDPSAGLGQPTLATSAPHDVSSCQYTLTWNTTYACADKKNIFDPVSCSVYNLEDHLFMNLTAVNYKHVVKISSVRGTKYKLQLCNTLGSSHYFLSQQIGNAWSSLGEPDKVLFLYPDNSTLIKIKSSTKCVNQETFVAEVRLKCDPDQDADVSKPYVTLESACSVSIEWSTSDMCYHKKPNFVSGQTKAGTLRTASTTVTYPSTRKVTKVLHVPHITVADNVILPTQPTTVASPPTTGQKSQTATFILEIIFTVVVLVAVIIVAIRCVRKRMDLVNTTSLAMDDLSSPGTSSKCYTRVRFRSDEKAKLI